MSEQAPQPKFEIEQPVQGEQPADALAMINNETASLGSNPSENEEPDVYASLAPDSIAVYSASDGPQDSVQKWQSYASGTTIVRSDELSYGQKQREAKRHSSDRAKLTGTDIHKEMIAADKQSSRDHYERRAESRRAETMRVMGKNAILRFQMPGLASAYRRHADKELGPEDKQY